MTGGRARLAAAGLALVLVVGLPAGCSSDSHKAAPKDDKQVTGTTVHQGDEGDGEAGHEHPKPTLVDPKTGKQGQIGEHDKYTAGSPPSPAFRQSDIPPQQGEVPLTVAVSPPCVEHGQDLTVVIKSDPGITVVAQIKWPNDQFSGLDNTRGTTGPDGLYKWTVKVQPTALYGQADLQAGAIDETNRSRTGSSGAWEFVVAPPGRC
jgi:hypothetical protein